MINVSQDHLEVIKKILKKHIPDCEVRVFGSRINKKTKPYSDLDIAVMGSKKLSRRILYSLKDAFAESDIPFRVDVLDWHAISKEFKHVVDKDYKVIQKPARN